VLVFEARELCKYYHLGSRGEVRALDGVCLGLERGSFTVLAGRSGSGKTTLLALLGGLDRPTRGQALFEGKDLGGCSDVALARVRRRLGFVFQDFSLIPNLSAEENITYPLIPRGVPRRERSRRAAELLARFGLGTRGAARGRELSGGEQQRLALARALAGHPEALLADEPTSNLDPDTGQHLLAVLHEEHARGKTVVLCSHDPQALVLATQVVRLEGGRLKSIGPPHSPEREGR
jgi:putative ABC transport system ATP-binding protein